MLRRLENKDVAVLTGQHLRAEVSVHGRHRRGLPIHEKLTASGDTSCGPMGDPESGSPTGTSKAKGMASGMCHTLMPSKSASSTPPGGAWSGTASRYLAVA